MLPCAIQLSAGALFTGTVVARLPFVYSVHVEEIFSGLPAHTKHLFLHSGPPCGSFFELGGRYLFHAAKPGRLSNNLYSAGMCSRTRSAASAAEDIAWLRAHARRAQQTRIFGTVVRNGGWNPFRPLEDSDITIPYAQVTITGQGKTYNTLSASDESYNFEGIPPGLYRIKVWRHFLRLPGFLTIKGEHVAARIVWSGTRKPGTVSPEPTVCRMAHVARALRSA